LKIHQPEKLDVRWQDITWNARLRLATPRPVWIIPNLPRRMYAPQSGQVPQVYFSLMKTIEPNNQ
jgi:hypothetical protein